MMIIDTSVAARRTAKALFAELDPDAVLLDPNKPACPDEAIFFHHQLKAARNERCIGNIKGGALVGDINEATSRA